VFCLSQTASPFQSKVRICCGSTVPRFKLKMMTKAEVGGEIADLWAKKAWKLPVKEAYLQNTK